jgi:hypothetical protein
MKTCTIVIKDEVNIKLGKIFACCETGTVGWQDCLLPTWWQYLHQLVARDYSILEQYNYDIELDDQREYSTTFEFALMKEDTFADTLWPKGHPQEGQPIVLRDYQVEIINNYLQNPQCIQEVATGAGKTIMTAALSWNVQPYGRSIVIVPNKSLVTQTEKDYVNLGLDVGVYFGDRKDYGKTHTICTWQSLNNLLKDSKDGTAKFTIQDFMEDVVCVIVDEVHMAKADALKTLLTGIMARVPIRWGLTGTIPKEKFESQACWLDLVLLLANCQQVNYRIVVCWHSATLTLCSW